jgi:hypothetical protein
VQVPADLPSSRASRLEVPPGVPGVP